MSSRWWPSLSSAHKQVVFNFLCRFGFSFLFLFSFRNTISLVRYLNANFALSVSSCQICLSSCAGIFTFLLTAVFSFVSYFYLLYFIFVLLYLVVMLCLLLLFSPFAKSISYLLGNRFIFYLFLLLWFLCLWFLSNSLIEFTFYVCANLATNEPFT